VLETGDWSHCWSGKAAGKVGQRKKQQHDDDDDDVVDVGFGGWRWNVDEGGNKSLPRSNQSGGGIFEI
jgi:hypothetical protein